MGSIIGPLKLLNVARTANASARDASMSPRPSLLRPNFRKRDHLSIVSTSQRWEEDPSSKNSCQAAQELSPPRVCRPTSRRLPRMFCSDRNLSENIRDE